MLGKPVIGKLQDPLVSGDRTGSLITSPKSPLEFKARSSRGFKNFDIGYVGLGIVAALEKSGGGRGEFRAKFVVGSLNLNRCDPIPVGSAKTKTKFGGGLEGSEMGCWENYTCVNPHGPSKFSFTRGYCDGGGNSSAGHDRSGFDRRCRNSTWGSNYFNLCCLIRRGEKAFCSSECRYRQIMIDEGKEKCGSEASRSAEISGSPYSGRQLFSTGITAS
ncbi:hypothetical protein HHK36_014423 [Tetracentron sinense]|uniref:FLZ-type domain-containing protein n=1 Tax=Tetracentron sinense TaxID=13715 RepID=A0A835DIB2_TETSI|nr:hypothetical protein HHK36_014423 [Tetracentron sinense]